MATFRPTECLIGRALCVRVRLCAVMTSARDLGPLRVAPWGGGLGSCFDVRSRPQHGTGDFRRSSRGPRCVEGVGKRTGANAGWRFPENQQPRGNKATVRVCCRSASRHVRRGCKRRVCPATLVRRFRGSNHLMQARFQLSVAVTGVPARLPPGRSSATPALMERNQARPHR
jgi:hypothetical protein